MEPIVKLEHVCKNFKNETVLKDVNASFERGKIYGIVGKNGAGKTVLFKTIVGFVHPTSGHVYVEGKEVGAQQDFAEDVGLILETPGFLARYNAYRNLEFLAGIRNKISEREIREAIRLVGLDPYSKKRIGKFSLGMRQRLGIAQAIMENPQLIILDEPMNGLDKSGIQIVKDVLNKLKQEGKTILMASHYAEDTEICDEVYEMEDGRLVSQTAQ